MMAPAFTTCARYYSPTLGRFISQDPIGVAGGLNLYAYAGNNPISLIDPMGTDPSGGGGGGGRNLLPVLMVGLAFVPVAGEIADAAILAAELGEAGGALIPMADAAYAYGTESTIAGYQVAGTAGMVGDTYTMNIWGLYAAGESEGLGALSDAIVSQAQEAGATQVSVSGNAIINEQLANPAVMSRVASMNGWTYQQISNTTVILSRMLP